MWMRSEWAMIGIMSMIQKRKLRRCAESIIVWHIRKDGYSLPMRIKFTVLKSTGRQQEGT